MTKRTGRRGLALLLAALLLLLFALSGCALLGQGEDDAGEEAEEAEENPEYPATAGGVTLDSRPGKVVSLAPALTEKLCDLGLDDRLVGASDYCGGLLDAPLPGCGTAQLPDLEGILALEPHLVLSTKELPASVVTALAEREIPVAVFQAAEDLSGVYGAYKGLAVLLEGRQTGQAVGEGCARRFRDRLDELAAAARFAASGEEARVLYLRLADFTAATRDSVEHQLLEAVGIGNIAGDYTGWRYPEKTARETGRSDFEALDLILLDGESVTIGDLEGSDFYSGLPVVREDRYLYIAAAAFERQGMGMLDQLERIVRRCYPDAADILGPSTLPEADGEVVADAEPPEGEETGQEAGGDD